MDLAQLAFLGKLPLGRKRVYLDNNATTPLAPKVRKVMEKVLRKNFGNPSSVHHYGREARSILEKARAQLASSLSVAPSRIVFTGCATESNNAVIKALAKHFSPHKKKIIASPIEHPSVMATLEYLKTQGMEIEYCGVDTQGRLDLVRLKQLMDDDCFLLCCMLANNESGVIQDMESISKLVKKKDCLLLCDCVQAFGKIPIKLKEWGVDYASFSAHKLYGPKGIGALYIKEGVPFSALVHGGHQETGLRAGTEALHNIAGFGEACLNVPRLLRHSHHLQKLKTHFLESLKKRQLDFILNSPEQYCLPNTISIRFPGISNHQLMAYLDYQGIAVSAASACSSRSQKISHVLKAIGLSDEEAGETIRISLGHQSRKKDIDYTVKTLAAFIMAPQKQIEMLPSSRLNKEIILDDDNYLLDLRPESFRKKEGNLPKADERSFFALEKFYKELPRDKKIIIICEGGGFSFVAAYFLKKKGFSRVSNVLGGFEKWKSYFPELILKNASSLIKD